MQIINNPWFFSLPIHFDNYLDAFNDIYWTIGNSILITSIGIIVALIASSTAAYSFSRFNFIGKNFLYFFVIMLLMIPGFVTLVPQFLLVKDLGMYNTYLGQALPPAAHFSALGVMLMRTFFEGLPRSLMEAAEIEGCGEINIYSQIILPLSKPIIATVAIMTGLGIWNNYVWSLTITSGDKVKPLILAITTLRSNINQGDGLKFAAYIIAALPLVVLFFASTKLFVAGLTSGTVKG